MTPPRFPTTSCSQCGCDVGPGDAGVSNCSDHLPSARSPAEADRRQAQRRAGDALQATASAALHRAKLAEQQRDEFKQLLAEARLQLPIAAAHWNECDDEQMREFHVKRVLELVDRIGAAIAPPAVTGSAS